MTELTAEDFVQAYPEFRPAMEREPNMIASALEIGALHCDPLVFKSAYKQAVYLMAAHQLALSPFGENLRIDGNNSLYLQRWEALRDTRRPRVMVGGGFGWPGGF